MKKFAIAVANLDGYNYICFYEGENAFEALKVFAKEEEYYFEAEDFDTDNDYGIKNVEDMLSRFGDWDLAVGIEELPE